MSGKSGAVCAVFYCKNYVWQKDCKSFFRFPKDKDRCATWVNKCKRADLYQSFKHNGADYMYKNYKICAAHFQPTDFNNPNLTSQGLKRGTVPSLHLTPLSSTNETTTKSRSSPKKRKILNAPVCVNDQQSTDHTSIPVPVVNDGILPDARKPKRLKVTTDSQIKILNQKLKNAQKLTSKHKRLISSLRAEVNILKKSKSKEDIIRLVENDTFIGSQVRLKRMKNKGKRYSSYDKSLALALHYCSPQAYNFLRRVMCLPTVRSIRKWLENMEIGPGLSPTILTDRSKKGAN